ncbi:uncharacterized protein BDFB_001104 [Asbolus verrucosus]|uniref:Uncharacterized protein n=1 Tax=Asbolus verrucosus TaxID=1661398 RepID=A0A482VY63_ASBVE|nr:uncharacterized protein BDFB_001104 [Asbolus verrucosus]
MTTIQQMFVALCFLLASQQITAVVNTSKTSNIEETAIKNSSSSSSSTNVADSVSAGTGQEAKRREAPIIAISDTYGIPLTGGGLDSYVPSGPSNPSLPIPVYGVPDAPSNNIVYPAPPPDIPPPLPAVSTSYGTSLKTYGPPQPLVNLIDNFAPPPPPPAVNYGPPIRPPKPFISTNYHVQKPPRPRPQYGPPKQIFAPKLPKPNYGPPKQQYGPPKLPPKPLFVPQKTTNFKQQSVTIVTIPNLNIGHPQADYGPPSAASVGHYGPPEPIPHGPPHPGVPAPPTPPDIKYDGWQPIPGLVSRPPSGSYVVPEAQHHGVEDLHFNADFTPPPISGGHGLSAHVSSSSLSSSSSHSISGGYSSSSHAVGSSSHGVGSSSHGVGASSHGLGSSSHGSSSHGIGSFSHGVSSSSHGIRSSFGSSVKSHHSSHNFHGSHGLSISSSGIGLIPPSGLYGTPPSGHYGTPLLSKPNAQYGAPLNALKINPPKHPVIFREPVPAGLIESIGQHTAHKDAHGIIESSHSNTYTGPTYIPPPIPDITKPVKEEEPLAPSHLYSLPNPVPSISFQSVSHGSSSEGLGSFGLNSNHFGGSHSHSQTLTSYTAPLGSVDGSYSLPLHSGHGYSIALDNAQSGGLTVGIDNSHPPLTIDLTSSTSNRGPAIAQLPPAYGYQNLQHDCSLHKSQPLPSLSYGVPSANSYTASLSSLTTNIGGAYQGVSPSLTYGTPDLHTAHSEKISAGASANAIETESQGKNYGKSLAASFGPESELIKSQSIDINNIPVQGSLGSYTLQIQPADGLGGSRPSPEEVPHAQVLNDGLLQSIVAAIENSNQKGATILGQPLLHLQPSYEPQVPPSAADVEDAEGQHSVTNEVVVSPPVTEATASASTATLATQEAESDEDAPLRLIENNEIALYFSNNLRNSTGEVGAVRNGQQYGSYVSFKRPSASFAYGNSPTDKRAED